MYIWFLVLDEVKVWVAPLILYITCICTVSWFHTMFISQLYSIANWLCSASCVLTVKCLLFIFTFFFNKRLFVCWLARQNKTDIFFPCKMTCKFTSLNLWPAKHRNHIAVTSSRDLFEMWTLCSLMNTLHCSLLLISCLLNKVSSS